MINFISIFGIAILAVVSGILYRLGGASKEDAKEEFPWVPEWFLKVSKKRDIGCSFVKLCAVLILGIWAPWFIHLASFILLFGALTTYWDRLFGYDNHYFHGFMCGLAYFPYILVTANYVAFLISIFIITVGMGLISQLSGNDRVEEIGRGIILVVPLLLGLI